MEITNSATAYIQASNIIESPIDLIPSIDRSVLLLCDS